MSQNTPARLVAIFAILLLIFPAGTNSAASLPHGAGQQADWQANVAPAVLDAMQQGEAEFLVIMQEQADLSAAARMSTKAEKGAYVYNQLVRTARRSQAGLLMQLEEQGAAYQSFWVTNLVWVRGDLAVLQALAGRPEVASVEANPAIHVDIPDATQAEPVQELSAPQGIEWNIQRVGAPQVWAAGFTGQGAVIAGQDTGYSWTHPALKAQYHGWDGATADHNYSWHDAIHQNDPNTSPGNPCGFDARVPCDDNGHGTHTMGTMVGDDGAGNQVGMAPGARWIGCRNMEQGWGRPSTYLECYQWFLAPTDLDGQNPRPDLAPDVINNSWSCPSQEGCTDPFILQLAVENLRFAGILSVHSAGNSGPSCGTVLDPAAIYDASFTVGATNSAEQAASFSARGLSAHTGLLKPDISAPGESIRSSSLGGGYVLLSGTSMAAPHVAGLGALLLSAYPELNGQVDDLEWAMEQTALPLTSTQTCGGIPGTEVPNPIYGWGRIDALAAFDGLRIAVDLGVSSSTAEPGEVITYTLKLRNNQKLQPLTNVVLTSALPYDTIFADATLPYLLAQGQVRWDFDLIQPGDDVQVELSVGTPQDFTGFVVNGEYSVSSDQLQEPITGFPVVTRVGSNMLIFPWIRK
jgi:uncharacterized repeat protein (TIGR01451 family)